MQWLRWITETPILESAHSRHLIQPDLYFYTVEGTLDSNCKWRRSGTSLRKDRSARDSLHSKSRIGEHLKNKIKVGRKRQSIKNYNTVENMMLHHNHAARTVLQRKTTCNKKQRQTEAELAGPSNAVKDSKKYNKIANIR